MKNSLFVVALLSGLWVAGCAGSEVDSSEEVESEPAETESQALCNAGPAVYVGRVCDRDFANCATTYKNNCRAWQRRCVAPIVQTRSIRLLKDSYGYYYDSPGTWNRVAGTC